MLDTAGCSLTSGDIKHRYEEPCWLWRWIRLYACWLLKYLLASAAERQYRGPGVKTFISIGVKRSQAESKTHPGKIKKTRELKVHIAITRT